MFILNMVQGHEKADWYSTDGECLMCPEVPAQFFPTLAPGTGVLELSKKKIVGSYKILEIIEGYLIGEKDQRVQVVSELEKIIRSFGTPCHIRLRNE